MYAVQALNICVICIPVVETGSVMLRSREGTVGASSPSPGDGRGLSLGGRGLSAGLPSTIATDSFVPLTKSLSVSSAGK